ncbi:MAG: 6,7-dimethyl-8-ribityllumazine synthase [Elusimicrobia bacterium]|nr:6,7-dimethyl-8-ribityllumazine synthase [Elusimicrobiota bacterium]
MRAPRKIGIAVSRFNEEITKRLLASCLKTLAAAGWRGPRARVVSVPGGYELPWAVAELARSGRYEAVIALGCVLKGRTRQNEHIARSLVASLHKISLDTRVPVILGVLTPDTWEQAVARTRGALDRGREAALAALEMAALREELRRG